MKRPFASKRPVGPFVQDSRSSINGLALIYTVENPREFPGTTEIENILSERYRSEREDGRSEVVATAEEVSMLGSPVPGRSRGIRVNTGSSIMNMEQFHAVEEVTTEVMENLGSVNQVAVAVSNP